MTKAYKDMNLQELLQERERLRHFIYVRRGEKGNRQNIKSLKRIEGLIWKQIKLN